MSLYPFSQPFVMWLRRLNTSIPTCLHWNLIFKVTVADGDIFGWSLLRGSVLFAKATQRVPVAPIPWCSREAIAETELLILLFKTSFLYVLYGEHWLSVFPFRCSFCWAFKLCLLLTNTLSDLGNIASFCTFMQNCAQWVLTEENLHSNKTHTSDSIVPWFFKICQYKFWISCLTFYFF